MIWVSYLFLVKRSGAYVSGLFCLNKRNFFALHFIAWSILLAFIKIGSYSFFDNKVDTFKNSLKLFLTIQKRVAKHGFSFY